MRYRVDWLSPNCYSIQTTWHATEDDALTAAHLLRMAGRVNVVAWEDSAVYAA